MESHTAFQAGSLLERCWGVLATVMAVIYTMVVSPIAALVAPFAGGRGVDVLGRIWSRAIIRTSGVKVEFRGLDHLRGLDGCIVVTNHQSMFDIFALLGYLPHPVRFVAKKELLKIPAFGYALWRSGHIVIGRQEGGREVRRAVKIARRGFAVVFFAEGHRFGDGRIHPFNEGAAWLGLLTRLPCVPLAISGSGAIHPRGALTIRPHRTIRLSFGAPIPTANLRSSDRAQLTQTLQRQVEELFQG
ncbi:MAG TPA: lysophospholipid acyltransferase family protein [Candidatus Binataceae bacterium]|nr:lysophospholipid acyltransferase family protein [Candidatus Binataceae bacterium]